MDCVVFVWRLKSLEEKADGNLVGSPSGSIAGSFFAWPLSPRTFHLQCDTYFSAPPPVCVFMFMQVHKCTHEYT